ncbi:squalene cyclase [Brachybacterium saurashtrense]|uniref:Squalene cyclase n=1 Tax=Brachybacterium saurashtrense TaxID=556288 RepID=A0A345YMX8_9MICO|nr:squalene cyclase [Brachybacterium saurashtrense]AXK45280.1 squalene cyclase [Brachybacterium saurashtrense]RRR21964.1 squalene cyclase [Brachybacterium saurashtrense]
MAPTDVIPWLLDTDPALRWQVERDLLDAPAVQWEATRARIPHEGFGAALLEKQDPATGLWAGGAFFPAGYLEDPESATLPGQPWTATTWSLTTLREWGMDPAPLRERDTAAMLARTAHWEYDPSLPYWGGEVDVCINAMTLANGLWLGADVEPLATWFAEHTMAEGGWNCEAVEGSTRASFHSTLNALRALHEHERATGGTDALRAAQRAGEEYLLQRRLTRRLSTGELVGPWVDHFLYPPRHIYTALRALDHFRHAGRRDPRMEDAIAMVEDAQQADGTWLQQHVLPGAVWFEVDVRVGEPSPWLTMQALRVLRWWHAG